MAYKQKGVQDEAEIEAMARVELSRLKRQYRVMENDRATCAEDARLQLRNQHNMINQLENEKAELALTIKSARCAANLRKDELIEQKLHKFLERRTEYKDIIEEEKLQMAQLQKEIDKYEKEVKALKTQVRSEVLAKEYLQRHERIVFILENRLEVATKRFNLVIAENAEFRQEIESLLKERAQFTQAWNKMISQLNNGKRAINDLVEQATITFNQRDEEVNKMQALRERGIRDLKNHQAEMCELQRTLDNEMKLQEFLGVKGQHREMRDMIAKNEAEWMERRQAKQNKISAYNQILQSIKEFTGEEDVHTVIAQFVKQEEENFALFTYVNELNDELEGLHTRMAQLNQAIEKSQAKNEQRGLDHIADIENLTQELQKQTKSADIAEESLTHCNEAIEKMLRGIDAIFRAVRCDNTAILELLGDNSHVTMSNVMLYMGLIERRIMEMLPRIHWMDKATKQQLRLDEDKKIKFQTPSLTTIAPTQPCPLCVEKEEMQVVLETLEIPLSLPEATAKLRTRLQEDYTELLHNVSGCHLPDARKIIQKRYQ